MRLTLSLLATLLTTLASSSFSQISIDESTKQAQTACDNTIRISLDKLRQHLGPYPQLRDKRDLVLQIPAADFNAFANYQEQNILIPTMWCVQTWLFIDAFIQVQGNPSLKDPFIRYLEYLNQRQRKAQRENAFFDRIPIQPFNDFAKVARKDVSRGEQNKLMQVQESMMVAALSFVIAHEIGHLALLHKPAKQISARVSRQQEKDADGFAARLLKRSGISIIPAIFTLQRFFQSEAELKGFSSGSRSHPRAECRLEKIIFSSGEFEMMAASPTSSLEFEKNSGYSISQYRALMRELKEDCIANP